MLPLNGEQMYMRGWLPCGLLWVLAQPLIRFWVLLLFPVCKPDPGVLFSRSLTSCVWVAGVARFTLTVSFAGFVLCRFVLRSRLPRCNVLRSLRSILRMA